MEDTTDTRLIEAGFPCHQVGAETQRGQSVGLQPPVNRLHVWWARRPLTASRAAILSSLLSAGTDPETFIRRLGIKRVQALVHGEPWTLTGKLLERIGVIGGSAVPKSVYRLAEEVGREIAISGAVLICGGSKVWSLMAALCRRNVAHGKSERQRSMVVESSA